MKDILLRCCIEICQEESTDNGTAQKIEARIRALAKLVTESVTEKPEQPEESVFKRRMDSIEAALKRIPEQPESAAPVEYQYRRKETHPHTVDYGKYTPWEKCSKEKRDELLMYIKDGYSYEVRELYAHPPASADNGMVRVPVDRMAIAVEPEQDCGNESMKSIGGV